LDCLFCKIINGEIPSNKVYEDEKVYAFEDVNPVAPTHILIVPKDHIDSLDTVTDEHQQLLGYMLLVAKDIAREHNLNESGYRVVNNMGEEGGQTVNHLHLHLIGGRSMQWPPG
jgi:histidine triad (HIT) family protein